MNGVLWVMHCAEGPVPRTAVEAARAFLEKELRPWELSRAGFLASGEQVRTAAARLFGVDPADFTHTAGTSGGLSIVAQTLAWEPGDEVVAPLGEFPSNVWPWKTLATRGVRFREVPLWDGQRAGREALASSPPPVDVDPEGRLLAALSPRTRVLTVSWVRFQDGLVLDLARLARGCASLGVILVVDGVQGAGTLPVSLEGVGAFATGVHKGLLSPQGPGLLWTRPALRERLAPLGSWLSVEDGDDPRRFNTDHDRRWRDDGRRLEFACPSPLAHAALGASLELLATTGAAAIATHVAALQRELLAGLGRTPGLEAEADRLRALLARGRLGSFLGVHHGSRGTAWLNRVLELGQRERIYATAREGYLRLALHGWHEAGDLDRLIDWLRRAAAAHQ